MSVNLQAQFRIFIMSLVIISIMIILYFVTLEDNDVILKEIVENCTPNTNYLSNAVGLIHNKTHIFQPQTCKWLEVQSNAQGFNFDILKDFLLWK